MMTLIAIGNIEHGETQTTQITLGRLKFMELHAAPATRGHMIDFLNAIEKGNKPIADIEEGHISTASCILANLSMDLKRPLVYDPKSRSVLNDPEATALLQREYRGDWEHPQPDTV